jgi:hypothetical protein
VKPRDVIAALMATVALLVMLLAWAATGWSPLPELEWPCPRPEEQASE